MNMNATDWEENLSKHISDDTLTSSIYKVFPQLSKMQSDF